MRRSLDINHNSVLPENFTKSCQLKVCTERNDAHNMTTSIQLLLKSLNTPADLLSQLRQSISFILRLYACSSSTNLIACKCAKTLEGAGQNF